MIIIIKKKETNKQKRGLAKRPWCDKSQKHLAEVCSNVASKVALILGTVTLMPFCHNVVLAKVTVDPKKN